MISGSNGERMCTRSGERLARRSPASAGAAQCSCLPAPSSATGTSSPRRTRASIRRRTAALLGASRWQIESRLTMPCERKRAVEQIGGDFARRGRLRRLVPAEMPRHQLVGLQHAVALADRQHAGIERRAAARASTACGSPTDAPSPPARRPRCRGSSAAPSRGSAASPCACPPA